uniref:Uncharacterized protein n=1 Tax=viral metagenome TaxID=1070528 RepID=A0A6C0JZE0_9ZZZZ
MALDLEHSLREQIRTTKAVIDENEHALYIFNKSPDKDREPLAKLITIINEFTTSLKTHISFLQTELIKASAHKGGRRRSTKKANRTKKNKRRT